MITALENRQKRKKERNNNRDIGNERQVSDGQKVLIWMVFFFSLFAFSTSKLYSTNNLLSLSFVRVICLMFWCLRDKTPTTLAQSETNGQLSFTLLNQSASYCWVETPTQITRLKCKEHYLSLNLAWASEIHLFFLLSLVILHFCGLLPLAPIFNVKRIF